ncbi:MAG TPA: hypothetical protein VIY86_13160, partial [Pirellulaceae bacterium]
MALPRSHWHLLNWGVVLSLLPGGFGWGITPRKADPFLLKIVPEDGVAVLHGLGFHPPDPHGNATEKLLAEPEVQRFIAALDKLILDGIEHVAPTVKGLPPQEVLREIHATLKRLVPQPFTLYARKPTMGTDGKLSFPEIGLVFKLGSEVSEVRQQVLKWLGSIPDAKITPVTIQGLACSRI